MKRSPEFRRALLAAVGILALGSCRSVPRADSTTPSAPINPDTSVVDATPTKASSDSVSIDLPFSVIRLLLPPDGLAPEKENVRPIYARNTMAFSIGDKNKWRGDDEFHRSEMAEIAFGYLLRAKEGDRDNKPGGEGPWGPGFQDKGSYVLVQGGWRAHHAVPIVDDFFDGTFTGQLRFQVSHGHLTARLESVSMKWNGPAKNIPLIPQLIEARFNDKVRAELVDPVEQFVTGQTALKGLTNRTQVSVVGTTIHIAVNTKP